MHTFTIVNVDRLRICHSRDRKVEILMIFLRVLIERQVSNHFEGVPFYGSRSDLSGPEINNRTGRNKRSTSDSAFMGSARDAVAQIGPEGHENIHLMKVWIHYLAYIVVYKVFIANKIKACCY